MTFAELFPELTFSIRPGSFAHDRGTSYIVEAITVAGETCDKDAVLQSLIRLRKGWGRKGENNDEMVKFVALAFVLGFAKEIHKEWIDTESANFAKSQAGMDYHKPKADIVELEDGTRAVVVTGFRRGFTGNHGTNYYYEVLAFNTENGEAIPVELAKDPDESPIRSPSPETSNEQEKPSPIPLRRHFVS